MPQYSKRLNRYVTLAVHRCYRSPENPYDLRQQDIEIGREVDLSAGRKRF